MPNPVDGKLAFLKDSIVLEALWTTPFVFVVAVVVDDDDDDDDDNEDLDGDDPLILFIKLQLIRENNEKHFVLV